MQAPTAAYGTRCPDAMRRASRRSLTHQLTCPCHRTHHKELPSSASLITLEQCPKSTSCPMDTPADESQPLMLCNVAEGAVNQLTGGDNLITA